MQPRTPSDPISFIISLSNAKQESHMKSVNKYTLIDWIEEINGHRGLFLESPGNFSGLKSNIQIEI